MKKILFLIHDLGQGGAEKVLVNLVNYMDRSKFDISVVALFGGGVNEQFLAPHIRYRTVFPKAFPGNSHIMKLFSPAFLHKLFVKEKYDIEVSYLEGPSARIISGCQDPDTKLVSWIHTALQTVEEYARSFRSVGEAKACYERFDHTVFVSGTVKEVFCTTLDFKQSHCVLYNTVESEKILGLSDEPVPEIESDGEIRLVAVGTLKQTKGYERLLSIMERLKKEGYPVSLYILGIGPQKKRLEDIISNAGLGDMVHLLGYRTNPYCYVKKCDLFVCASFAEGFSTAATEALILGVPVCTVEVSGMKEMLGEHNEYGIVTENSEEGLYRGLKSLLDDPELLTHYKKMARVRGKKFNTQETVDAVEEMLLNL